VSSCATRARTPSTGVGGRYTEIEPPTRLAFTWLWDGDTRRTLIALDFEETDGVTTVSFAHSGLWDVEAQESRLRCDPRSAPSRVGALLFTVDPQD
jgi:uncharacterized protein YndB with AHSA1/START domain